MFSHVLLLLLSFLILLFGCFFKTLFIYGALGPSLLLHVGFLELWRAGAPLQLGDGLLTVVTSLVVEPWLSSTGLVVVAHRLSCSEACGIFPDQGSNRYLLDARQMLNCWATREAPTFFMDFIFQNNLQGS